MNLIRDAGQPLVCPDGRVLKLPGSLSGGRRFFPLQLPGESPEEWAGNNRKSLTGKLRVLLGCFLKSKLVQLRIDFERLHCAIIPSVTLEVGVNNK